MPEQRRHFDAPRSAAAMLHVDCLALGLWSLVLGMAGVLAGWLALS